MMYLQQIILQFSSIHRSLPVPMPSIFVNMSWKNSFVCLSVRGIATSQRQVLVASPSTCFFRLRSDFCGSTTLIYRLICRLQDYIVLRLTMCVVNIWIFRDVRLPQWRMTQLDWRPISTDHSYSSLIIKIPILKKKTNKTTKQNTNQH